jgi:hypothetical protein
VEEEERARREMGGDQRSAGMFSVNSVEIDSVTIHIFCMKLSWCTGKCMKLEMVGIMTYNCSGSGRYFCIPQTLFLVPGLFELYFSGEINLSFQFFMA